MEKKRQNRKRGLALILASLMVLNLSGISQVVTFAQEATGATQTINHLKITSQDGTFEVAEADGGLITITSAGNYTLSMDGGPSSTTGILVSAPGGQVNLVLDGVTLATSNYCLKAEDTTGDADRLQVNIDLNGKANSLTYTEDLQDVEFPHKYFGTTTHMDMTIMDSGEGGSLAINGGMHIAKDHRGNLSSIRLKKGTITIDPKQNWIGGRDENYNIIRFGDILVDGADLIIPENLAKVTYKVFMDKLTVTAGSFTWKSAALEGYQGLRCQLNLIGGTATVGKLGRPDYRNHHIGGGVLNGEVVNATITGGRINGPVLNHTNIQPSYTEGDPITINGAPWNAQESEKLAGKVTLWIPNGSDQNVIVGETAYEYKWDQLSGGFRLIEGKKVEITSDLSYQGVFPQGYNHLPSLSVVAEKTNIALPTDIITYQWYENKVLIPSATESSFTVPVTTKVGDYTYHCDVSCGGYSVSSGLASVKIINGLASVEKDGNYTYYDDLSLAFRSVEWNKKATITLLQDINLGRGILGYMPGEVTLDLNGKTLSSSSSAGVIQDTTIQPHPLTITGSGTIHDSGKGDERVGAVTVTRQLIIEDNVTIISDLGPGIVCSSAVGVAIKDNAQLITNGTYPLVVVKGGGNISLDGGSLQNTNTNKIISNTEGSVFINKAGIIKNNGSVEALNTYFNVADPSFSTIGPVWHKISSDQIDNSDKMTLTMGDNATTKHDALYGKKGQVITLTAKAKPGHIIYDMPGVKKGTTPLSVTRIDEGDYITEENTCTFSFTMPDHEGVTLSVPVQAKSSLALVGEELSKVYDGKPVTLDTTKGNQLTWDTAGVAKHEGYYLINGAQTTTENSGAQTTGGPPKNVGSYYAKISISQDNNKPSEMGYLPFTIRQAKSSVVLEAEPEEKTYGGVITLKANVSGENQTEPMGTVVFKAGNTILKSDGEIRGGVATFLWENYGLGDHSLTAEFIADASKNHSNALSQTLHFNVSKRKQEALELIAAQGKQYGDAPFVLSTRGGSGAGLVTYEVPANNGVLSISGDTATIIGAGTVTITASKAEDNIYQPSIGSAQLIIEKKPITIKADDKINVIAGTKLPELTYQVSGLVEGDSFSDPVLLATAPDVNTIGDYDIRISGGSLTNMANYAITYVGGRLTIVSGDTITIKGINNPISTGLSASIPWSGDYVYYGSYKGAPIKWRVLDTTGLGGSSSVNGAMLLQAANRIEDKPFDQDFKPWDTSDIRTWLRGEFLGEFTPQEKQSIQASTASPGNPPVSYLSSVGLADDSLFLLDASDLGNNGYGYFLAFHEDGINTSGNSNYITSGSLDQGNWWLRSKDKDMTNGYSGCVKPQGGIDIEGSDKYNAIIPAFNLNLSTVFAAAPIPGEPGSHKLTLVDQGVEIAITPGNKPDINQGLVRVPYTMTGPNAANVSHLRLMITDKAYTENDAQTIYQEKWPISDGNLSGRLSFTLPEGYLDTYKVYLMAEDANGTLETDYVSLPLEINVQVKKSRLIFKSFYGQEMSNKLTASSGVTLPKGPTRYGYNFTGWSMTQTQIQDAIENGVAEIIVQPVYELIDKTYTIRAQNGILTNQEGMVTERYKLNDVVIAKANPPAEGSKFSHWSDGVPSILSYGTTYQFYATKDLDLMANYVSKDTVIKPIGTTQLINVEIDRVNDKLLFVSMSTVPKGSKILQAGVIATDDESVGTSGNGFNKDTAGVRANPWTGNAYRFTWTKNVAAGDTWYVRPYLLYQEESGDQVTVYGNMASQTY